MEKEPNSLNQRKITTLKAWINLRLSTATERQLRDPKFQQAAHDQVVLEAREMREPISEPLPEEIDIMDQFNNGEL